MSTLDQETSIPAKLGSATDPLAAGRDSDIIIRLDNVTAGFGDHVLIRNLSLKIGRRDTMALVGPSGCGKTTLLRLMAGLHRPLSGTVTVAGPCAEEWVPPTKLFGSGHLQYLHQDPTLWEHLTVYKNIVLALRLLHVEPSHEKIQSVIDEVGLRGNESKFPCELSKGMKARLALARVFVHPPDILLADEPFASLDAIRRERLNEHLLRLRRVAGCTTVMVTHDIVEALRFATRMLVFPADHSHPQEMELGEADNFDPNALPLGYLAKRDRVLRIISPDPRPTPVSGC